MPTIEFCKKDFTQYRLICTVLKQTSNPETVTQELKWRKEVIYRTITTAFGQIDMRMYINVYLYIICGYSMTYISMQNNCDKSTVCRDIKRFFIDCKNFFDAVIEDNVTEK